jgi:hypothetical protein
MFEMTSKMNVAWVKTAVLLLMMSYMSVQGQQVLCNVCGKGSIMLYPINSFIERRILFVIPVWKNCGRHKIENAVLTSSAACVRLQQKENMRIECGCTKIL